MSLACGGVQVRAMIVTASQLASYDQAKEMIMEKGLMNDGIGTHVMASFVAGFVASVASYSIYFL